MNDEAMKEAMKNADVLTIFTPIIKTFICFVIFAFVIKIIGKGISKDKNSRRRNGRK